MTWHGTRFDVTDVECAPGSGADIGFGDNEEKAPALGGAPRRGWDAGIDGLSSRQTDEA